MILVDTSIWIDHLHAAEPELVSLLQDDRVAIHSFIIQELALVSIKNRTVTLRLLSALRKLPSITHDELLTFVDERRLWGRGLSAVDVHLLGSAVMTRGARLWTRDKRLQEAAAEVGVPVHTA